MARPGLLRDRILYELKTINPITNDTTWSDYATEWANCQYVSSDSIQSNLDATEITRQALHVEHRYRSDIHAGTHRIRFDGKIWNIVEPIHDQRRTMLMVDATWIDPFESE